MSATIKNNQNIQHGGKRKNAGRKPSTVRGLVKKLPGDLAKLILADIDAESRWKALIASDDERIVFEVLRYLTDRAFGKSKQLIDVNATVTLETLIAGE